MAGAPLEQPPQAGNVVQISFLAIAVAQPGENTEDLAVALRAQNRAGDVERRRIDGRKGGKIAVAQRNREIVIYIPARVLHQRDKIIGNRPCDRILEIKQAAS